MTGLTADQQAYIDQHVKETRPQYYDALTAAYQTIGADFEAFLLLADPDLRDEIIFRLGQSNNGLNPDRELLYAEALRYEVIDATLQLVDYTIALAGFSEFRDRILASPSGTSTDIAPMIEDIQRNIGVTLENRERMFHTLQAARVLDLLRGKAAGTSDEIKQRASWTDVITAYR